MHPASRTLNSEPCFYILYPTRYTLHPILLPCYHWFDESFQVDSTKILQRNLDLNGEGASGRTQRGAAKGAILEVRCADGVWRRGRLVERVAGSKPMRKGATAPSWRVLYDDGEARDDIRFESEEVRFDASEYGAKVKVRFEDGEWYRGSLVQLLRGGEQWGVAFDGGGCQEDVMLGDDPNVRFVFSGGGSGRDENRGKGAASLAEHHSPAVSHYLQVQVPCSSCISSFRSCSIGQETPPFKVDVCSRWLPPCIPFRR